MIGHSHLAIIHSPHIDVLLSVHESNAFRHCCGELDTEVRDQDVIMERPTHSRVPVAIWTPVPAAVSHAIQVISHPVPTLFTTSSSNSICNGVI